MSNSSLIPSFAHDSSTVPALGVSMSVWLHLPFDQIPRDYITSLCLETKLIQLNLYSLSSKSIVIIHLKISYPGLQSTPLTSPSLSNGETG